MDGTFDPAGEQATWRKLGAELRRLRTDRSVSLSGLARQVNYTKGYLSKIENGKKRLTPELAHRLDKALQTGGVLVGLLPSPLVSAECLASGDEEPDPAGAGVCPYPGLVAFGPPEARWFFGRDQATSEVISRLDDRPTGGGPLVVVAPSGAGKSSLLAAGLIPALAGGALPGSCGWLVVVTTPGAHPLATLAAQVAEQTGADPAAAAAASVDPERFAAFLASTVAAQDGNSGETPRSPRVVLIVDQFEETFTACQQEAERQAFITALCTAAHHTAVVVVLGVRADFYGHCLTYPTLLTAAQTPVALGPMSPEQLRSIITGPADAEGLQVEPGLVELLLRDLGVTEHPGSPKAGYDPGALPLLAHALRATWQQRNGRLLTVAGYQRTGGIQGAIATTAEHAYTRLSPPEQQFAQQLLLRLVQVDTHTGALRRRAPREWLIQTLPAPTQATEKILETFVRARLLTFDTDSVEITHEALLHAWPRLTDWITADRAGLRIHHLLSEAAEAWNNDNRDPSLLYRGSRLAIAHDWATGPGHQDQLSGLEGAYLQASIDQKHHEQHAQRRRTRRLRTSVGVLAISLVVALLAGSIAIWQYYRASATELAATSYFVAARHPDVAMLLAVEAHNRAETPMTRGALLSAQSQYFAGQLTGHSGTITKAVFSPDGRTLATASADHTVRLWDVTSHRPVKIEIPGLIHDVEFNPDGHILAIASDNQTVRLWDVSDPHQRPHQLALLPSGPGTTLSLSAATFSHDGHIFATVGADGTAQLWDMASRHSIATLTGTINKVAFSPDGRTLATGSRDNTVRLWNVADPTRPAPLGSPLTGRTGRVTAVAFSPDGHTLATASTDDTVILWDLTDRAHPSRLGLPLTGHISRVTAVAFSPDGRTLATGSADTTARLWSMGSPILTSSPSAIGHDLVFSSDGRVLATSDSDNTVRLWNVADPTRPTSLGSLLTGPVNKVALSPDGHTLATSSDDGTVRLWNVATHQLIAALTGHTSFVSTLVFSLGGHTLATGCGDGTVRLWNVADPTRPAPLGSPLTGHTGRVTAVAFSPDGHTLATASIDSTARLWNVATQQPIGGPLIGHTVPITTLAFSDNHLLTTASRDGTARRWQADTGQFITTLTITTLLPGERFSPLAFSSDGHILATTSGDETTTELWDADKERSLIATLTGHTSLINAAAFSRPDGGLMATVSDDGTVRLWDLDPKRVTTHLCSIIGTPDQKQWERFLPDLPYHSTCP